MNNKNEAARSGGSRTSAEFDWSGFGLRLVATLVLVLATYNPSGWSCAHWLKKGFSNSGLGPKHFVVGVIVLIGWVILLTATQRSMGTFGLILEGLLSPLIIRESRASRARAPGKGPHRRGRLRPGTPRAGWETP